MTAAAAPAAASAAAPAAASAPAPGRYRLALSRRAGGVSARVERCGARDILSVMVARPLADAPAFAALAFPVCPHAHQGAALDAVEKACGVSLSAGQAAARSVILLSEAVAACVWRAALTWPALVDAPGAPALVSEARSISNGLVSDLYADGWARTGGAAMRVNRAALREKTRVLGALAAAAAEVEAKPVLDAARGVDLRGPAGPACPPQIEETPRSIYNHEAGGGLAAWFEAQRDHTRRLVEALADAVSECTDEPPAPCPLAQASGAGVGVAMTARGRLRHAVEFENGMITRWRARAPTDLNFAPGGPVEAAAARLSAEGDLARRGRWLVAAFDPCVPCTVEMERADA